MGQPITTHRYFKTPNFLYEKGVSLTLSERALYGYLSRRSNALYTSFPSYRQMADDLGIGRSTCIRAIRGLLKKGLIERTHHRVHQNREFAHNSYRLLLSTHATDFFPISDNLPKENRSKKTFNDTLPTSHIDTTWYQQDTTIFKGTHLKNKEEDDLLRIPQGDLKEFFFQITSSPEVSKWQSMTLVKLLSAQPQRLNTWENEKPNNSLNLSKPENHDDSLQTTETLSAPLTALFHEQSSSSCDANCKQKTSQTIITNPLDAPQAESKTLAVGELQEGFKQLAVTVTPSERMQPTLPQAFSQHSQVASTQNLSNSTQKPTRRLPLEAFQAIEQKMRTVLRPDYSMRNLQGEIDAAKHLWEQGIPLRFILENIDFTFTTYGEKYKPNSFAYTAKVCLTRYESKQVKREPIEKDSNAHNTRSNRKTREQITEHTSTPSQGKKLNRETQKARNLSRRSGNYNPIRVAQGSQAQWNDKGQDQRYAEFYALFPGETTNLREQPSGSESVLQKLQPQRDNVSERIIAEQPNQRRTVG